MGGQGASRADSAPAGRQTTQQCQRMVKDVGISAIYMYFPRNVVNQTDMEQYDAVPYGATPGKYTKGLGQKQMAFCGDNEDVVSLALTAVSGLLREYAVDPNSIGFLSVGTETMIDKSKSVKSELLVLFPDNRNLEGADVKHACYGGAQALFHAVDWMYSNHEFDGRNAIVVMSDIAIYEKGPARPTGGAGAIALLITPDAPIVLDRGLRVFDGQRTWDFFKPTRRENVEFPVVDGGDSVNCYLNCLTGCYEAYRQKSMKLRRTEPKLLDYDGIFLHCPYSKLVQKAVGRLAYEDNENDTYGHQNYSLIRESTSLGPKDIEKLQIDAAQPLWKHKTDAFLELNRRIGNMYTPSLLAQLLYFISCSRNQPEDTASRRLLLFAYGSGALSAMFSLTTEEDRAEMEKMRQVCQETVRKLDERETFTPEDYTKVLESRERLCQADVPYTPSDLPVFPFTYVLSSIDNKYRRTYRQTGG